MGIKHFCDKCKKEIKEQPYIVFGPTFCDKCKKEYVKFMKNEK